MSKIQIAIQGR